MKKLFLVLAVSAAFVACGDSTDTTTTTTNTDSSMMETPAVVAPVVTDATVVPIDSTVMMDSTTKM